MFQAGISYLGEIVVKEHKFGQPLKVFRPGVSHFSPRKFNDR